MFAALLKSLTPGEPLRLRNEVLPKVKVRNWAFLSINKSGVVLLGFNPKGRILAVFKENEIDWDKYEETKGSH